MKKFFALAAVLAFVPCAAMAQDGDATLVGVRAEARIGYETPTVSDSGSIYKIGSAVSYGGELGFDFKLGKTVQAGPYAVYEFSSVSLCNGGACVKEQGNLGAGLRVGVAVSPKVVIYAKGGYARISFKATSGTFSATDSKGGVQGALGVDVNLSKHVYLMAELNYGDYGNYGGVNLARRHVAGGVGFRF
ncbi:outer membrane beta-barrel protein [Sphingomonas sp. AR_OL41]|uniref:outer membrane beta-barrel protein n=1 Tax=Sphingomonas sp. AR_OL41 TaxID=3042729 RepID=UPI002480A772|nr:outer membrane beta-barrel protein [Sphingomonas sp. AR_OL41]MDH7976051.1 outer membrane beta-barrel protein [Sphingomonas sp. AR_OL41]